jgi:hypothetical protein
MMDEEVKQLCDELFKEWSKSDPVSGIHMYLYTLAGRTETKLCSLANELSRVKRELDILKVQAETWKQSYLEQVKENVKMQAEMLADEQA